MARSAPTVVTVIATVGTGSVIAIVVGAVSVIMGAIYAIVKIQGDRITETRADANRQVDTLTARIERLDQDVDRRITELSTRLEHQIDALGDRLAASYDQGNAQISGKVDGLAERLDGLAQRLDRVEDDLRARS